MSVLGRMGEAFRKAAARAAAAVFRAPSMASPLADESAAFHDLIRADRERFWAFLRSDDDRLLKEYLFGDGGAVLRELLDKEPGELNRLLLADGAAWLTRVLAADGFGVLKSLYGPGAPALAALMMDDGGNRLKALLDADDRAVLKALYGTGSKSLRALMLADDAKRLKALLGEDDYAFLKSMLGPGSTALREVLLDDGAKRLQRVLFAGAFHELESLFRASGHGALRHLLLMDESRLAKEVLGENNARALHALLFDHGLIEDIVRLSRARAHVHFAESWDAASPVVDTAAGGLEQRIAEQRQLLLKADKIWDHLTLAIAGDGVARLRGGELRIEDRGALWTLMHEILINEDYYADFGTPAPRILDCGAHIGMGLFYFMTRHPAARLTAFEPDPQNFAALSENVARNKFAGVELLPYALSGEDGVRTLYRSEKYSMASSLSDRRGHLDETLTLDPVEVQCRRLSPYLREPVDFLKLDIEGEEDRVLAECADGLRRVHYLFCEYHQGPGLPGERLAKILQLLSDCGFDVHVGKSHGYQARTKHRPMAFVGEAYSAALYARNRNWPPVS